LVMWAPCTQVYEATLVGAREFNDINDIQVPPQES
jgi:hypothetical protein